MSVFTASPETGLCPVLFPGGAPRLLAVVGAGGKTSAVKTLAAELSAMGRRVIVTTTTKMHPPEDRSLLCETAAAVRERLERESPVWAGVYYNEYKIEGLPGPLAPLRAAADHVLIEADGARKLPLKMIDPAHEPVIPPEADAVLAIAGLDALGRSVGQTVHRPALACQALGVSPEHIVAPADMARLLTLCYAPSLVLLNKADGPDLAALGREVAAHLPGARCVITSLRDFGHMETR